MGRIRILSDTVANKIAAGEVVERPASVVKELLENSLDAGATEFRLDVEAGGRRLIRLADNGCGMMRDDALLAFERHATSKLSDVKDLLSIATLGFRGEALPSIASVSRLLLETRSRDEQTRAPRSRSPAGRFCACDEAALAGGTTITVRDLFFNVPGAEEIPALGADRDRAHRLAESRTTAWRIPRKAFSLRHNQYRTAGGHASRDAPRARVSGVRQPDARRPGRSGRPGPRSEAFARRIRRDAADPRRFRLRGFVSGPQVQKLNRNSIYLFVNGRLIRDRLLLHAISSAYHNLMPPACYPFALLFLDCDLEEVDVNVHPSKTEVRFRHGSLVHDFVRDTIREALMAQRPASRIPAPASAPARRRICPIPSSASASRT